MGHGVVTCLVLSFLRKRGETRSSGWKSILPGVMDGCDAGCCMLRNAWIDFTSDSYELSAIVLPLEANRHAAIHLAYCSS